MTDHSCTDLSVNTVQFPGQLYCYGDNFFKIIGGERTTLVHNFSCPECTGQTLIYGGVSGVSVSLSTGEVHVFLNGTLLQSLPLSQNCFPLYLYQSHVNPERIWIQCRSSGPSFYPTYNLIEHSDTNTWVLTVIVKRDLDVSYKNTTTNAIVVGGRRERFDEDFVIAIIQDSPEVIIHPDTSLNPVTYSLVNLCDTLTTLYGSEPFDEENYLQFVVDCVDSNGQKKRWVITLDGVLENAMDPYELQHTSGTVSVTREGNHFLIHDMSRIILVNRYNPNSIEPAVKNFSTLITGTRGLMNNLLLVELPSLNRFLLNMTEFVSTTAEGGTVVLPGSEAYCPNGVCPASVVVQNKYLVVFVKEESYLLALAYELDNPYSEPSRVGKIYVGNFPHICFFKEGDTPFLLPSPGEESTEISTTTLSPGTTETTSSGLDTNAIIGTVFGVIVVIIIVALPVLCTLVILLLINRTNSGKDDTPLKFNSENSRVHGQKSEEVETKDRDEVTITIQPCVTSVSGDSSGIETSSAEFSSAGSSRLSTPLPPLSNQPDPTYLYAANTERTSDYSTEGESSSSPSPQPHRQNEHPQTQQDGVFSSDRTRMVAPELGKVSTQLQTNSNGSNSIHPPLSVQEESNTNLQISQLVLQSQ